MLRTQLQTLQAHMEQQRAEVQAANARHMQWESELTAKLNTYRDERRGWMLRVQELGVELDKQSARIIDPHRGIVGAVGSGGQGATT